MDMLLYCIYVHLDFSSIQYGGSVKAYIRHVNCELSNQITTMHQHVWVFFLAVLRFPFYLAD